MAVSSTLTAVDGRDLPPLGFSHTAPYDPARFETVTNSPYSASRKPEGGLWLAPLVPGHRGGVRTEWVGLARDIFDVRLATWPVAVRPDARVLRIDSHTDFEAVTAAYPPPNPGYPDEFLAVMDRLGGRGFDFEAIAEAFDAIWLTGRGAEQTRHTCPGLNTWDIESVLVLRPDAVADP